MAKLSFLISTNRPYDDHAKVVVDGIERQNLLDGNEIIICSNDPITDDRVINVEDQIKINGSLGFNQAAECATGDIFLILCDDHELHVECDIAKIFEDGTFNNREYKITTMATKQDGFNECFIGSMPKSSQAYKRYLQGLDIDTSMIPKAKMCRFPILTRETYDKLGKVIFHPNFNLRTSFFPDNYLSYFLYINGEECIQTKSIYLSNFKKQNHDGPKELYSESLKIFIDLIKHTKSGDPYL